MERKCVYVYLFACVDMCMCVKKWVEEEGGVREGVERERRQGRGGEKITVKKAYQNGDCILMVQRRGRRENSGETYVDLSLNV